MRAHVAAGAAAGHTEGERQWMIVGLARAGPRVSAIGLGCMGMSGMYGPADRGESIATIHAALDAGITLLDTGDFYGMGHNEMLIGEALAACRASSVLLSVKFGALRDAGRRLGRLGRAAGGGEELPRLHAAAARSRTTSTSIVRRGSIPRCRSRTRSAPSPSMVKAGYVRHIGLSEVGAATMRRAAAVHPICDLQIEYSLISRGIEDGDPADLPRTAASASRPMACCRAG